MKEVLFTHEVLRGFLLDNILGVRLISAGGRVNVSVMFPP